MFVLILNNMRLQSYNFFLSNGMFCKDFFSCALFRRQKYATFCLPIRHSEI